GLTSCRSRIGIRVPAASSTSPCASSASPSTATGAGCGSSCGLIVVGASCIGVLDPFGVRAAVALELGFDPVDRFLISCGSLTTISELSQSLDRRFVFFQFESADQHLHRIFSSRLLRGSTASLSKGDGSNCGGNAAN